MKAAHLDLMIQNVSRSSFSALQALKQAIRQVSLRLAHGTLQVATTHEDKVGCTMPFLLCADRGDVVGPLRHASRYLHLRSLADPADPFLRKKASLQLSP